MEPTYQMACQCGDIQVKMRGAPRVRGHCHCGDCRELLNTPYHSVNAWERDDVTVTSGREQLLTYQHPHLTMKKFFCQRCGDVIFNSNGADWRVFSQHAIRKSYSGDLPEELRSKSHFFYDRRIVDVDDSLPKKP